MPRYPASNLLLVEGATEKRLIPELMEARGVRWEPRPGEYAVEIKDYGGVSNLLAAGEIETAMKASGVKRVGLVFDADGMHDDESSRWERARQRCRSIDVALPTEPNPAGYRGVARGGIEFGVWMMPNNRLSGMLETFLLELRPETGGGDIFRLLIKP